MPLSSISRGLAAALLAAGLSAAAACAPGAESPERPDVLLVTIDSLRADRPGFAGGPVKTPSMDRLAAGAAIFTSAYTPAPQTLASLASLHTGLYPARHGARLDGVDRLADGVVTLAAHFKRQGYLTAGFPAALTLHPKHGLSASFDVYRAAFEEVPRLAAVETLGLPAQQVTDRALELLESLGDAQPFFLWVNYFDPHYFHTPASPWKEQYEDEPYDGEIAQVDHELGRLLDGLREHGREGRTLIVLAGNHGEGLGDGGEQFFGILLRESTLRVPLVIRTPGAGGESRRIAEPVSLVDVAPTLIDLVGEAVPPGLDGVSLRPLVEGGAPPAARPLYFETLMPLHLFGWAPLRGVRSGSLKYVEAPGTEWRALYDLASDPGEATDLSGSRPGDAGRLATEAGRIGGDFPAPREGLEGPLAEAVASVGLSPAPRPGEVKLPTDHVDLGNAALQARRSLERGMAQSGMLLLEEVLQGDPGNYVGLMSAAKVAVGTNKLPVAEHHLREAQARYPADGEIYHQLGHVILMTKPGPEGLRIARRLFETAARLAPLNEEALYDAACSVSRENQDLALGYLEGAVRNGYRDFANMARDPDMDPLRASARFQMITGGLAVAPPPQAGAPAAPGGSVPASPTGAAPPASPGG